MGREKPNLRAAATAGPQERHRRLQRPQYDPMAPVPPGLIAKPAIPKSKHHSYLELVENKDKRKKLEFQVTAKKKPPPGFEFVPIGNPQLTTACKELSREKDAMIFIVSNMCDSRPNQLAMQTQRIGHHIRESIVDEARAGLDQSSGPSAAFLLSGQPEPIPKDVVEYHLQVDAMLRESFPRIPNTDRELIKQHAFTPGTTYNGKPSVGLSADLPLVRRVQLAVLAHIRHTHTRYDSLLRQTSWENARRVVEGLCLDVLVKWRGDEESGRDQLDEILREVVVISDSENDDSGDEGTDESSVEDEHLPTTTGVPQPLSPVHRQAITPGSKKRGPLTRSKAKSHGKKSDSNNAANKKSQKGFKRYRAWEDAIQRNRLGEHQLEPSAMERTISQRHQGHQEHDSHGFAAAANPEIGPGLDANAIFNNALSLPASLNRYTAPQPFAYMPPLPEPPHSNPPPQFQPAFNKVNPTGFERSPSVPGLRGPGEAEHLKDFLVQSIEPPSPTGAQPSFVRTLPPQRHLPVVQSPLRSSVQYGPQPVALPRDQTLRDKRGYYGRRVVSDLPSYGIAPSNGYNNSASHLSMLRDQNLHSYDRNSARQSPLYHSGAREPDPAVLPAPPPARRIIVDAPRPGERSNPILMEDRGGFYERVPDQPDNHSKPYVADDESRQPVQPFTRLNEPHRVVSWEVGARILQENQGNAGVEIIPISGPHILPPEARSHVVSTGPLYRHSSPSWPVLGRPDDEMRPEYEDRRPPEHRLVSEGGYIVDPPRPHWEEQRNGDRMDTAVNHHPRHQPFNDHYRDGRVLDQQHREYQSPHRQPENVIVLE